MFFEMFNAKKFKKKAAAGIFENLSFYHDPSRFEFHGWGALFPL